MAMTTPNDLDIRDSVTIANCEIFTQGKKVNSSYKAFRKIFQRYKARGFFELLKFKQDGNDLAPLLVSKTSTRLYNTIVEMIERNIVEKPQYITKSFENHQTKLNNQLFVYISNGLK